MILTIPLAERFGRLLGNGADAYAFRMAEIDPYVATSDQIIFDFNGVRAANSSFINALITGLIADHGEALVEKLVFRGCLPTVRVLVQGAVDLGITKTEEQLT